MAKNKKHKPKWKKTAPKLRNASSGGKARGIGDSIMEAVERTAASAGGGAASALIGGLAVSHSIMEPETFGLISTVAGAALASRSDTKWREAFNGAAAAGAGQLVLGWMAKRALKSDESKSSAKPDSSPRPDVRPNGAARPSNAADGDGHVVAMFRDMAGGLDDYFEERARRRARALRRRARSGRRAERRVAANEATADRCLTSHERPGPVEERTTTMDENNQPIVYVLDTRNADHRTTSAQPTVVSRTGVPIAVPRVATPTPYYGQPRVIYAQQPAPYAAPYASTMQSWFGNVSKGEVVDLIIQGLVALTPPPDAPNSTGDIGTDLGNLMLYQGAVTTYEKRDEQLRTLGYGLRKLLR